MSKEQILKKFDDEYLEKIDKHNPLKEDLIKLFTDQKQFLIKAISQTIEETIKEERLRASKIVEYMMEDSEHWQPIVNKIITGDILNKLKI